MDTAVDGLVLAPLRDIVRNGITAVKSAEAAEDEVMLRAAHGLVKEGERALQHIEPVCRKHLEEFGSNFINALKDNEEISRLIEDLNNLLYDFDDYVGVDNFDIEKVAELQGRSRKAIPRICHIITRMRLAPAHSDLHACATASPDAAEPATAIGEHTQDHCQSRNEPVPYPVDNELDFQVKYAMSFVSEHSSEFDDLPTSSLRVQQHRTPRHSGVSPASPSTPNPWLSSAQEGLELVAQLPENVVSGDFTMGPEPVLDCESSDSPAFRVIPVQPTIPARSPNRIATNRITANNLSPSSSSEFQRRWGREGRESISSATPRITSWDSVASSASASIRSSVSNERHERDSYLEAVSPKSIAPRLSRYSTDEHGESSYVAPLFVRPSPASSTNHPYEVIASVVLPPPSLSIYDGLIPVEEELANSISSVTNSDPLLSGYTITQNSSFVQFKGFCQGAKEAIKGGTGIRHIKKQVLTTANIEVAKCKDCAYELEWEAVRRDINCEASENFTSKLSGIGFRLRFLSKSHIYTKYVGEQTYGCLFCVQLRHTTHPNDATVFFSQQQLFAHLARHPKPLPKVSGLTVVESEEVPSYLANNYDLHLPNPPLISHLITIARDLTTFPIATALQTVRPTPMKVMRASPDRADALSFAAGAKILGVEFPDKYQGQWCIGWVDHKYGAIPAEAIQLDPPRKDDATVSRRPSSSSMKAVARWRFFVKEKENIWGGEWLCFSRGEVITNIGWSYQDHWCWWGTNSKGKSGIFARSFIEPGTLMEVEATPHRASSSVSSEKRSSILSRISLRYRGASG